MPDDLQPQEGQGDAGTGGIFDPYLSAVPEEARDAVAGYLKDAEKNVNGRLAEAADLQKNLGPYKDVDLSGYDPEILQQLIAWHQQTTADPDAYKQFIEGEAKELGITPQEAEEVIAAEEDDRIVGSGHRGGIARAGSRHVVLGPVPTIPGPRVVEVGACRAVATKEHHVGL